MGLCRFDVIKYRDETVQNRPKADANADLPDFLLGCIMLDFRITHHHFGDDGFRDFVLIRRMKTANRSADGARGSLPSRPPGQLVGRSAR